MSVIDFTATRFANDAHKQAVRLIDEAEEILDDEPMAAGRLVIEAWVILNAAAVTARRLEMAKIIKEVEQSRNKIRSMRAALSTCGYTLETDFPDASMAFLMRGEDA